MENKTTTELLELIIKIERKEPFDSEKFSEVMDELKSREPFYSILNEDNEDSLPAAWEVIKELQETVKELKRHKHDERSGDVMIRI